MRWTNKTPKLQNLIKEAAIINIWASWKMQEQMLPQIMVEGKYKAMQFTFLDTG